MNGVVIRNGLWALGLVAAVVGACWGEGVQMGQAGQMGPGVLDVRAFGARGDGERGSGEANSAAFARAFGACHAAGGGAVFVPATGGAFHLAREVHPTGNGCGLLGVGVPNWPGPVGPEAAWTASGSWVACDMSDTPCLRFGGSGYVDGVNFWQTQPEPDGRAGVPWVPCNVAGAVFAAGSVCGRAPGRDAAPGGYAWMIQFNQNFSTARRVQLANATYGIAFEYPFEGNITGTYSGLEHIWAGCFEVCIRFRTVNDTMHLNDIHVRHLWQVGNANVTAYMERRLVGWDVGYLDNATGEGIEFYKTRVAMRFSDGRARYGAGALTHAAEHLQLTNVAFNQVCQAMAVENGTTQVSAELGNVIGQSDTDTGCAADAFFDLASDNVDVTFNGLRIGAVGHSVMAVGGGRLGRVQVHGVVVSSPLQPGGTPYDGYGYLGKGAAGFVLARGSVLSVPTGLEGVKAAAGAGVLVGCAGADANCGSVRVPALRLVPAGR